MKRVWLYIGLLRLRRVLAVVVDLALLTLVSAGVVWLMRHRSWTPPVPFGVTYWGAFLLCLLVFGGTPGMYVLDLRIHDDVRNGRFVRYRYVLRVASSYVLFVVAPNLVESIAASAFSVDLPLSVRFGLVLGFLFSGLVTSFLLPHSVQDLLSGTMIGPRRQALQHDIQPSVLRIWFGLGLVASVWIALTGTYMYGAVPVDFEKGFTSFRQVDSLFLQSQLGVKAAPIFLRERPGSPFFRPANAPGPSLAITAVVNPSEIDDTGERRRIVNTIINSLSYLEWAGQISEQVAEITLMTPWSYGYVVSRVSYSYVGTWRRPDICAADGGITEGAMEMLRQAARAANAERVDVGGLELARIPFADVKPESHGTVMVVVAPPSVDREVPPIMMIPLSE